MNYVQEQAVNWSDSRREEILSLQGALVDGIAGGDLEEYKGEVKHYFAPGLYSREIFMKAGAKIVGKIHKHAHMNTISMGGVMVFTEHGEEPEMFFAPCSFVSTPGTKRVVMALEDTIWTTYHPTEETDLEKIEEHVIAESYEELETFLCYEKKKELES